MDFKKYEQKFRKTKTSTLLKDYHKYNADFRRIAREEFKKRNVPASKLPYKSRKRSYQSPSSFWW
jgi:hypothetical protein